MHICVTVCRAMFILFMVITYSKVVNPARGQLADCAGEMNYSLSPFTPENLSDEAGSAVPSRFSLLISILRLNLVLTYGIPPEFRGGVHS